MSVDGCGSRIPIRRTRSNRRFRLANQVAWSRFFLEGAVIDGSILLALTADALWDERQERKAEADAVLGLDTDFSENLTDIHARIATHEDFVRRLARLEAMTGAERRMAPADSVASFANAMATPSTFATHDGTLDALIASGQLGIIEMPELSNGLSSGSALLATSTKKRPASTTLPPQ